MKENPTLKVAQKPYNEGSIIQILKKKKENKHNKRNTWQPNKYNRDIRLDNNPVVGKSRTNWECLIRHQSTHKLKHHLLEFCKESFVTPFLHLASISYSPRWPFLNGVHCTVLFCHTIPSKIGWIMKELSLFILNRTPLLRSSSALDCFVSSSQSDLNFN